MQRITRDHTVPPNKRYHVREPVAEVELGETFVVETINFRSPVIRTPADANPKVYREREETGPIYVRGIEPGSVLAIHIEEIRPEGHASGPRRARTPWAGSEGGSIGNIPRHSKVRRISARSSILPLPGPVPGSAPEPQGGG